MRPRSTRNLTVGQYLSAPIGVFDSGIGGLSILQALRHRLPHEHFVYVADSAHAPYGERGEAFVVGRSLDIAQYLRTEHQIKALVVACNTATAAAIAAVRATHHDLPIVGVEPALKPALKVSQTRRIGVLATRGTVGSIKFQSLLTSCSQNAQFVVQACDGLAKAIEAQNNSEIRALFEHHTSALGPFGHQNGQIDTVVLGCTHYTLERAMLQEIVGPDVHLVEPGEAIARRLKEQLQTHSALMNGTAEGSVTWHATGRALSLMNAVQRWCTDKAVAI